MASFNKVILIGNLTRDPELKYTPGNQAVCEIGLAVNRKYRTKDNEDREETTFVDCEAWGKQAEVIKQYMTKGRPIFIEGRLKLDTWEDKKGGKRSKMRVRWPARSTRARAAAVAAASATAVAGTAAAVVAVAAARCASRRQAR